MQKGSVSVKNKQDRNNLWSDKLRQDHSVVWIIMVSMLTKEGKISQLIVQPTKARSLSSSANWGEIS